MKKSLLIVTFATLLTSFGSMAQGNPTPVKEHAGTAQYSLNWQGSYEGTLPCADCEGTKTNLILNKDNTYKLQYTYLKGNKPQNTQLQNGTIKWDPNNTSVIHLISKDGETLFLVGEKSVSLLDSKGQPIKNGKNVVLKQIKGS